VCNETDRKVHYVGSANAGVPVSPEVLARYTGQYEYREGSTAVAGFMGMKQNVSLVNGRLYLNALPLIPQTETMFESTGSAAEFFMGADGKANRLVLGQTEGAAIYDRKP